MVPPRLSSVVSLAHNDCNDTGTFSILSETLRKIAITSIIDIHCAKRMNPDHFGVFLTFHLEPLSAPTFNLPNTLVSTNHSCISCLVLTCWIKIVSTVNNSTLALLL